MPLHMKTLPLSLFNQFALSPKTNEDDAAAAEEEDDAPTITTDQLYHGLIARGYRYVYCT